MDKTILLKKLIIHHHPHRYDPEFKPKVQPQDILPVQGLPVDAVMDEGGPPVGWAGDDDEDGRTSSRVKVNDFEGVTYVKTNFISDSGDVG